MPAKHHLSEMSDSGFLSASLIELNYTVGNEGKFSGFLMIYIIDGQITYNSDDCTLTHMPTQETLGLSISSGRLFEQLLNSQGEVLAREILLTEVWDKYGLRGSNSNLNQYLSMLRRALAAYGCENLIITIPKIGIRLNTDISIERESPQATDVTDAQTDEVNAEDSGSVEKSHTLLTESVNQDVNVKKPLLNFSKMIFFIIILVLLGSSLWYYAGSGFDEKSYSMSTIKLEGGCEAVILQGLNVFEKKSLNKEITEILKENNQSCIPGRRIYFDKKTSLTTTNYGRTMLSACNLNSSGHIVSCDNFYYLDWRTS